MPALRRQTECGASARGHGLVSTAEFVHPLSLLNDPMAYAEWVEETGSEEAEQQMTEAIRERMKEHGVRSVLDVAEKMDDCIARMEEFSAD